MRKNILLLLLLGLFAWGGYHLLTKPIKSEGGVAEMMPPSEKKARTETAASAIPKKKTLLEKTVSSPMLRHTYSYGTTEKLPIVAQDKPYLVQLMQQKPKKYTYQGSRAPKNWQTEFYNLFLSAPEDENILDELVAQFQRQARELYVTPVELAIAYVQDGIAYDFEKAAQRNFLLQYPYETIYRRKGVCADKTILLSKLLTLMDYKHVLMEFPRAQHIAIGLKVPTKYDNFGTGYAFVETTNTTEIGVVPENYVQGIQIKEPPNLIVPHQNGRRTFIQIGDYKKRQEALTQTYGKAFKYGNTRQKQLAVEMKKLEQKIEKLDKEHLRLRCAERTVKTESEIRKCRQLTEDINDTVKIYNDLVKEFNEAGAAQ